jgi:hypothetical protein
VKPSTLDILCLFDDYWSGIRESNSRLDLGKVAYYHYTNPAFSLPSVSDIYSTRPIGEQGLGNTSETSGKPFSAIPFYGESPSIHFKYPRGFDDWRFLLTSRKTLGTIAVNVHARKSFPVVVEHGHLPVLVLPSLISQHPARLLWSLLFHVECALGLGTMASLRSPRK